MAGKLTRKSVTGGSYFAGAFRAVGSRQVVLWDYEVGTSDPSNVNDPQIWTDLEVIEQIKAEYGGRFPAAGGGIFHWPHSWVPALAAQPVGTTRVAPWMRCTLATAERDPVHRNLWRLRTEFGTDQRADVTQGDLQTYPLASFGGYADYPKLTETVWSSRQQIQDEENTDDLPKQDLRLPTNSPYAQPFYSQFARRTLRISLFEKPADLGQSIEQLVETRMFAVASTAFGGDPAPVFDDLDKPARWMITNVEYQPVELPYNNAGNIGYDAQVYMSTYTVERAAGPGGWWDRRALIDYYYLKQSDDLTTLTAYREPSDAGTIIPCLLNGNGTKKEPQTGDPSYRDYRMQKAIPFTFLQ